MRWHYELRDHDRRYCWVFFFLVASKLRCKGDRLEYGMSQFQSIYILIQTTTHLPFTDIRQYYTNDEITRKFIHFHIHNTLFHSHVPHYISTSENIYIYVCINWRVREREQQYTKQQQSVTMYTIPANSQFEIYYEYKYGINDHNNNKNSNVFIS